MTEFLSASFVIIILSLGVFGAGAFAFLNLLAGKSPQAIVWLLAVVIGVGLLIYILGGF
ncbi:MAG: hypothetical protein KI789_00040 [Hoeflea sp.]|nr:hypothetical protein [Hoeflea sp.]